MKTFQFPEGVEFEFPVCDHCKSAEYEILFSGPDRLLHLPGTFQVVRCTRCGWLRQSPRPTAESIGFYYPPHYDNFYLIEKENWWKRVNRRYGLYKRRRFVERYATKGRILDVGCATGSFLIEMGRAGWETYGIEPNDYAVQHARRYLKDHLHQGTLQDVPWPHHYFDAITLWDVFEHLQTPWQDLQRAYALLRPGGVLFLRIPNLEGIEAHLFKHTWIGWDLPRHLYFVPPTVLAKNLSEELQMRIIARRSVSTAYPFLMMNLKFKLEDKEINPELLLKLLGSFPLRLLSAPFFYVLSLLGAATTVTLVARK